MGGGLIQLVAYGAQDVYLTGNPQITFFKVVYRRHTNFTRENIEQIFDGTASMGNSVVCTLSRSGDLVNNIYLTGQLTTEGGANGNPHVGHSIIKSVEVEIGGQKIDKHYGQWLQIYSELNGDFGTPAADDNDNLTSKYVDAGFGAAVLNKQMNNKTAQFYIPLRFWFCNNPGLALPLIALQYHEVKIKLSFISTSEIFRIASIANAKLLVDYIYLDTDERRRFAQVSHEYLIEQVQHEGKVPSSAEKTTKNVTVNYNHPVKYIAWVIEDGATPAAQAGTMVFNPLTCKHDSYTSDNVGSAKLMLNGNDRFEERNMDYFTRVQPYQHFKAIPSDNRIGVYSFANNPMDHQPSGTCNFSRIDSAIWQIKPGVGGRSISTSDNLWMFAVNYNVLRIMSGMGGLAYSN